MTSRTSWIERPPAIWELKIQHLYQLIQNSFTDLIISDRDLRYGLLRAQAYERDVGGYPPPPRASPTLKRKHYIIMLLA